MRFTVLSKLLTGIDFLTQRYQCSIAQPQDRAECYRIRRAVFGDELRRDSGTPGEGPGDVDEFDEEATHVIAKDTRTGQIVGSLRSVSAEKYTGHPAHLREYALAHFPERLWPSIVVASRLAVVREHRKKGMVGMLLAMKAYEINLLGGIGRLSSIVCEPNLYPLYRQLGYRPLDRAILSPFGGYRLPLFLILHDYDYLERARSPLMQVAKKHGLPTAWEGIDWYVDFVRRNGHIAPGFSPVTQERAETYHSVVTVDMSSEGTAQLMHHAIEMECQFGDTVIAAGYGDRVLGFVESGMLEIRNGEKLNAVLGQGDIFGEVAFLLQVPRTADVIAASDDTKVVFLSLSAVSRLKSKEDQIQFWKNLACHLAERILRAPVTGLGHGSSKEAAHVPLAGLSAVTTNTPTAPQAPGKASSL